MKDGKQRPRGRPESSALATHPGRSWFLWASVSPSVQWPWVGPSDPQLEGQSVALSSDEPIPATPTPHTDNSVLCGPNTPLRPLPLPTVLTGTRCSKLVVLGVGVAGPSGLAGKPWVWPRDL